MGLGEILDRILHIYKSRLLAFAGMAALPVLVMELIHLADSTWLHVHSLLHPFWQPGVFLWNFLVGLAFYHVSSVFSLLVEPAIVKMASSSVLGEDCSVLASLKFAGANWRRFLWIAILKVIAELCVSEIVATGIAFGAGAIVGAAGGFDGDAKWGALLIVALWVLVGCSLFLWLGACFAPAIPAATIEGLTGFKSLQRSWRLSRGARASIWFTWLAAFVSMWILAWGLELLLGQAMSMVGGILHVSVVMRHLYGPAVFILLTAIYAFVGPLYPIALSLFYYDQRIRKEGFDIERMMETAGMNLAATSDVDFGSVAQAGVEEGQA